MRPVFLALASLLACGGSYGLHARVTPAPNAPHLPPSAEVHMIHEPPPSGARELARIEINGSGDGSTGEQETACTMELAHEAKRLGADVVQVVAEGHEFHRPSVAYCTGVAYVTR